MTDENEAPAADQQPTTAQRIVDTLESMGVEYVFGYPGGRVIEVFEALAESSIRVVRPRDEREASVMAEAYGRITRNPGVLAGQGPWIGSLGAIGQMEARLGSSPMVVLTEASERGEYSTLAPYQQARGDYGGLDLPSILDGVTTEHWFPRTPTETVRSVQLAFKHARAGRPGPTAVILDGATVTEAVPADPVPPVYDDADQARVWHGRPAGDDVRRASQALAGADRPVVIAGNGVHASGAADELAALAETYDAAVVTSYLGKATLPETHERAAGVIGSFGHEGANRVVSEADVLLVVGCRLNPMDTNWVAPSFVRPDEQTILHADIDPRNAGWTYPADVGLVGDAAVALDALAEAGEGSTGWALERARRAREDYTAPECDSDASPVDPRRAVAEVERIVHALAGSDDHPAPLVTADSGNNRFWLLQYLQAPATGTYYGSGGVGGMGWAAPAAVTAALVGRAAIAVAGDGGFAMTMTAVESAVEYGVAPTFVVLNDTSLGMVRQMDDDIPGVEFHDTDFTAVAEAMGARGVRATDPDTLGRALETATGAGAGSDATGTDDTSGDQPTVIDVRIDGTVDMAETLQSSFYAEVGGLHE